MVKYAFLFLIIANVAAVLGFGGTAKVSFVVCLILAVASFIFGRGRP